LPDQSDAFSLIRLIVLINSNLIAILRFSRSLGALCTAIFFKGRLALSSNFPVTTKKPGPQEAPGKYLLTIIVLLHYAFKPVDEWWDAKTKGSENSSSSYYIDHEKSSILSNVPHISTLTFSRAPRGTQSFFS
jgi:hypothetical protein